MYHLLSRCPLQRIWLASVPSSWEVASKSANFPSENSVFVHGGFLRTTSDDSVLRRWLRMGADQARKTSCVIRGLGLGASWYWPNPQEESGIRAWIQHCGQGLHQSYLHNGSPVKALDTGAQVSFLAWQNSTHYTSQCAWKTMCPNPTGKGQRKARVWDPFSMISAFGWFWFISIIIKL